MKILIVGLGLIGGSYAKGLTKKGHTVYGCDINNESINFAREHGYIVNGSDDPERFIKMVDLIIVGLYPTQIVPFLEKYNSLFNENQVITDVCGIKSSVVYQATKAALPAKYCGSHPMAGREKAGVTYADEKIFTGTNFLITPIEGTDNHAFEVVKGIAEDLEFGTIHSITPEHHDKMIAYTSQLTHAIAVSLVDSETAADVTAFIGDSYRDLTRIAMINEKLWSELFIDNKLALIEEIEKFEQQLSRMKVDLLSSNYDDLKEMFKLSKARREVM